MQGPYLRKYGVATTVDFVLFGIDGVSFKVDAAHAAGDTKIMKNEGAEANTASGFVDEGQGYSIALSATEMQAARIVVYIVDQGTKVWLDTSFVVETYGHASAMHAFDLDTATVNLSSTTETQIDNIETDLNNPAQYKATGFATAAALATAQADLDNPSQYKATGFSTHSAANVWAVATRALTDKAGFALSTAGIKAIWDQATSALTTAGSIGKLLVDNINATISSRSSHAASAVWSVATRLLTAGTNIVLAKGTGITGFSDPSAAAVADAVWDENIVAAHNTADTAGAILDDVKTKADFKATGFATATALATAQADLDNPSQYKATGFSTHNAAAIWAVATRALTDKAGFALSTAGIKAIWDQATSALTTAGSIGKLLVDNINATISSRSSHAAADIWSVVTRVLTAGTNIVLAKGVGVTGLNDLSAAEVNAEVVDALNVDTYAEPGQGAPAATASLAAKIGFLYKALRNKITQTATTLSVYNDAEAVVDQKATVSDDGSTYTRGEIESGP